MDFQWQIIKKKEEKKVEEGEYSLIQNFEKFCAVCRNEFFFHLGIEFVSGIIIDLNL